MVSAKQKPSNQNQIKIFLFFSIDPTGDKLDIWCQIKNIMTVGISLILEKYLYYLKMQLIKAFRIKNN